MSWTRAELKSRAKVAFKRNYWKCVLAAFILSLVTSSGGGGGSSYNSSDNDYNNYFEDYEYDDDYDYEYNYSDAGSEIIRDGGLTTLVNSGTLSVASGATALVTGLAVFLVILIIIAVIVGAAMGIFLFNPIQVGGCHFFLENAMVNTAGPGLLLNAFKLNYKSTVLTMFLRGLYTFLWTLLFIIPGIIKSYEYYMVPYILADHPEMSHQEVFALSKKMMDGEKWNTFVLELSFIGWQLLNGLTIGILGLFYVNPYVHATHAELYLTLKRNKCQVYDNNTYTSYTTYTDNNNPYQSI